MPVSVEQDLCTGCRSCEETGPNTSIKVKEAVAEVDQELCSDCGACVEACPTQAVKLAD